MDELRFWRSELKTEISFLNAVYRTFGKIFNSGDEAKTWLTKNNYFTDWNDSINITDDSLIIHYDIANNSCFRGDPTYNELLDTTWSGDGGPIIENVTHPMYMFNNKPTVMITPGTSLNCYLHGGDLTSERTSTEWTFSCYIKRIDSHPIEALNVYMYYPTSDGSAAGVITYVGNGWYRIYRTRYGENNYISLAGFIGFDSGQKYLLSCPQLEKKSYPTAYVNTNEERSNSFKYGGGLLNLTQYDFNGDLHGPICYSDSLSLDFNGLTDYIILNNYYTFGTYHTISLWINFELVENESWFLGSSNKGGIMYDGFGFLISDGTESGMFEWTKINGFVNLVIIKARTYSYSFYINCKYIGRCQLFDSVVDINIDYIGRSFNLSSFFKGSISNLQIYNKILTSDEMLYNYNSTKSRFL